VGTTLTQGTPCRLHHSQGIAGPLRHCEARGILPEFAGLEFAGLENDGPENDGLENDGVEQQQTYILHTKKNFNVYDM